VLVVRSTAAVHTGDMDSKIQIPLEANFLSNNFNTHLVKVTNTKIQDINQLMDYRDAY